MERLIAAMPEVAAFSRRTGSELGLFATAQNTGDIVVRLRPRGRRQRSADEIIADLRDQLPRRRAARRRRVRPAAAGHARRSRRQPEPIEVKIFGDDPERAGGDGRARRGDARAASTASSTSSACSAASRKSTWTIDPVGGGALRPDGGAGVARSSPATGWARSRPTLRLLDRTGAGARAAAPTPCASIRCGWRRRCCARPTARRCRCRRSRRMDRAHRRGRAAAREPAADGRRQRAPEGRDLGSAVAEIRAGLAGLPLPIGYTLRDRRAGADAAAAFRELLLVFALAGGLVFVILVVQFRRLAAGAADPAGGAAVVRRRPRLLWVTGTDLNISSAMGLHPARRPGRQERHHAARLLRAAARRRRAVRRSARPRRPRRGCGRS